METGLPGNTERLPADLFKSPWRGFGRIQVTTRLTSQTSLPIAKSDDLARYLQRESLKPLKPAKDQLPCDVDLFGDEANQLDLIEMFMDPA